MPKNNQKMQESLTAIDDEITELVTRIRNYQSEAEQLDQIIQTAKQRLLELLEQRGSNWQDDEGFARLMSEGTRTYYDTKALDALIINDPLHYGWLKDYRKASTIRERVNVR